MLLAASLSLSRCSVGSTKHNDLRISLRINVTLKSITALVFINEIENVISDPFYDAIPIALF